MEHKTDIYCSNWSIRSSHQMSWLAPWRLALLVGFVSATYSHLTYEDCYQLWTHPLHPRMSSGLSCHYHRAKVADIYTNASGSAACGVQHCRMSLPVFIRKHVILIEQNSKFHINVCFDKCNQVTYIIGNLLGPIFWVSESINEVPSLMCPQTSTCS